MSTSIEWIEWLGRRAVRGVAAKIAGAPGYGGTDHRFTGSPDRLGGGDEQAWCAQGAAITLKIPESVHSAGRGIRMPYR